METIKCNGKCQECRAAEQGLVENIESCAIMAIQRRTFEISTKINNLEQMIIDFISKEKEVQPIPAETSDELITTKKRKEND